MIARTLSLGDKIVIFSSSLDALEDVASVLKEVRPSRT